MKWPLVWRATLEGSVAWERKKAEHTQDALLRVMAERETALLTIADLRKPKPKKSAAKRKVS